MALTRARDALHLFFPQRYYRRPRGLEDPHSYSQVSRFLTPEVQACFEVHGPEAIAGPDPGLVIAGEAGVDAYLAALFAD